VVTTTRLDDARIGVPAVLSDRRVLPIALAVVLVAASCAGGDADTSPFAAGGEAGASPPAAAGDAVPGSTEEGGGSEGVSGSGGVSGSDRISFDAAPATAYAEVDGERFVYEAVGSIYYTCEISPDTIRVNFQTPDGQNLSIQAGLDDIGWSGQFAYGSRGEFNTQYSVALSRGPGILGVIDGALSYEGVADRIEDYDVLNAEEVNTQVAVNCGASGEGGDPMAVIDGETFMFSFSGAQAVDCAVSADNIDITINRLAVDDLQLSIDMRGGPGDWIGSVFAVTPAGNFSTTLSGEAEGLVIDGNTVTYVGPIGSDLGGEVDADVSATCP
jgi:hypothetical protein